MAFYDPLAQVNEKVRSQLQGLFAGNPPRDAARAIQDLIEVAAPGGAAR